MLTDTVPNREATSVKYYRPVESAVAAEFDRFMELLPRLRETHGGEYVAVSKGSVIASGVDLDPVLKCAVAQVGAEAYYCGWVEPVGGYVFRAGSPSGLSGSDP